MTLIPYIHFYVSSKDCSSLTFPACLLFPTVLQMSGDYHVASDPLVFWRTILKSVGNTALNSCLLYLLCVQWAIWLATCQLKTIEGFQVRACLWAVFTSHLFGGVWRSSVKTLHSVQSDVDQTTAVLPKQWVLVSFQVNFTMVVYYTMNAVKSF